MRLAENVLNVEYSMQEKEKVDNVAENVAIHVCSADTG